MSFSLIVISLTADAILTKILSRASALAFLSKLILIAEQANKNAVDHQSRSSIVTAKERLAFKEKLIGVDRFLREVIASDKSVTSHRQGRAMPWIGTLAEMILNPE
jgi:hypothetical protein